MKKQLIVNADDYGRTPGVTRGIIKAYKEGIVTSTTVMMNMPGVEEAVALADKGLGMGVHLVFTSWKPLLPPDEVRSLVDERGYFLSQEAIASNPRQIDLSELKKELKAQIERLKDLGREPDHLDCHHFVYMHPTFFAVYLELAEEHRLPVRLPFPPKKEIRRVLTSFSIISGLPLSLLHDMVDRDIELARTKRVAHPDYFIASFYGETATLESLLRIIEGLQEGVTEMLTHPGFADEELLAQSTYALPREVELELLCDPRVKERIKELGIELVDFSVLR